MAAFIATLLLASCTSSRKNADISEYIDDEITISGLLDDEFTVTPRDLLKLEQVSQTQKGATEKAGTVNASGPLLNTFLAEYGCTASDFNKIRFIAKDAYRTLLRGKYLTDYDVIMALSSGEDPLAEDLRPMRLLIPGAESSMWIYGVVRIEFEKSKE